MTLVKLRISDAAFDEIMARLIAAGADELTYGGHLNMHGIALVRETEHRVAARPVMPEWRDVYPTQASLQ